MNLYHITERDNLPAIQNEGLKPSIGPRSKAVLEKTPHLYLCRYNQIPYWRILLDLQRPAILRVVVDENSDKLKSYTYDTVSEYHYDAVIPPECIKRVSVPKPFEDHMKKLCIGYLYSINYLVQLWAKYQFWRDHHGFQTDEDRQQMLQRLTDEINSTLFAIQPLDYSTVSAKEIADILRKLGNDGEYTLADTYQNTYTRLWQKLYDDPNDPEANEPRKRLYEYIRKNFKDVLYIRTGGFLM